VGVGGTRFRILYCGPLGRASTSLHRLWALQRLGHDVLGLDDAELERGPAVLRKCLGRLRAGPAVNRYNRRILEAVAQFKPHVFWGDKPVSLWPSTLRRLKEHGVFTLHYEPDAPFGPRRDHGWRLLKKNIPLFDLNVVPREADLIHYPSYGARRLQKIQFAYEPTLNFPPPEYWSDANRPRSISFIGSPYDQRGAFISDLSSHLRMAIHVNGPNWHRAEREHRTAMRLGPFLSADEYRMGIWQSKINLAFLTHSNQDDYAHKAFEITACGGFLLAERCPGHLERFREGTEAVFFSSVEECAAQIARYLPDEETRTTISKNGQERSRHSGYDNDTQMSLVINTIASFRDRSIGE